MPHLQRLPLPPMPQTCLFVSRRENPLLANSL
jgi:hypothetical protein